VSLSWWHEALMYRSPFFFFTWLEHSPCEPSCNTESLRLIDIAEGGPDRNECLVDRSKRGPLQSLWEKGQPISTIVFTLQETKSHHPSLGMPVGQAACSLSLSLCKSRLRIPLFQRLPGESDEGFILLSHEQAEQRARLAGDNRSRCFDLSPLDGTPEI
jgi:hypothetical protein